MKVFSKQKFMKVKGITRCTMGWPDECDGKLVRDGWIGCYRISDDWCIDVPDAVEETGKILNRCFPNGFPKPEPKPAPEAVNCRCAIHTKKEKGRFRIIIDCDGDTTTARMLVDGRTVKKATAKRNPADKFNWRIGAQTAFNRLWEKKKKPVKPVNKYAQLFNEKMMEWAKDEVDKIFRWFDKLPPAVREVKRYAEPGEWVKVVNATVDCENDYKNGDVLLIVPYTGTSTCEYAHYKDEDTKFLYDDEYVVLEGCKPE